MVNYKHYTYQLQLFLHEILFIIIISYHKASYHLFYLYNVICCSITIVLNSYTDYLVPLPDLCGAGPWAQAKIKVQNGHITSIWFALFTQATYIVSTNLYWTSSASPVHAEIHVQNEEQ